MTNEMDKTKCSDCGASIINDFASMDNLCRDCYAEKQNRKYGFIKQNRHSLNSLILATVAVLTAFKFGVIGLILLFFSVRQIGVAKNASENKKILVATYVLITVFIILVVLSVASFVYEQLSVAGAL